jgi:hypothetical protein
LRPRFALGGSLSTDALAAYAAPAASATFVLFFAMVFRGRRA